MLTNREIIFMKETTVICKSDDCLYNKHGKCVFKEIIIEERGRCRQYTKKTKI